MSILLHGYEQLIECTLQVEQVSTKVEGLEKQEENSAPSQSKLFDF
jgi:hypothetical protein